MINRIFQLMEYLNYSASEFANELGISKAVLSSIKTGRTQPSLQLVEKIKSKYPLVSLDWLVFGTKNMLEGETNDISNVSTLLGDDNVEDYILNNKKLHTNVDLAHKETPTSDTSDIHIPNEINKKNRVITKIIVLYSDSTFEEFHQ